MSSARKSILYVDMLPPRSTRIPAFLFEGNTFALSKVAPVRKYAISEILQIFQPQGKFS